MDHQHLLDKEFAETSTSSFARSGFQYRSKETAIDFGLLRQTQKERITHLLHKNATISQEKLLEEFERIQEETNHFIESLLEQLAVSCRRLRNIQADHEVELRQHNIQARRLTEDNMKLAAALQAERMEREQQAITSQKEIHESQQLCRSLWKECEGIKKLLEEYEIELQSNQNQIQHLLKQHAYSQQVINGMKEEIQKLTLTINACQSRQAEMLQEKKSVECQLSDASQLKITLEQTQKQLIQLKSEFQIVSQQSYQLRQQQIKSQKLVQYLQMKLLQANGEISKHELQSQRIKLILTQSNAAIATKEQQMKTIIQELQLKTKQAIQKIAERYNRKFKQIHTFYQHEIKTLKASFKTIKQDLHKQMLLCCKLTQRDLREHLKNLFKSFSKN